MTDLNARPGSLTFPTELISVPIGDETAGTLLGTLWHEVVRGSADRDGYVELIGEKVEDEALDQVPGGSPPGPAGHLLKRSLTTLERAFQALRQARVPAEMDFTCCSTGATSEVGDTEAVADKLDQWLGYVFFHSQDTGRLIASCSTYLSYGLLWPAHITEEDFCALLEENRECLYEEKTLALMNEVVVPVPKEHGITVEWNGRLPTRTLLRGVDGYAPLPAAWAPVLDLALPPVSLGGSSQPYGWRRRRQRPHHRRHLPQHIRYRR
ncbi:MAG: hypothetical protein Q4G45_01790 [Actinomycetia bacterium]|nr:hypothetical protein [Actinomycetes bacterium]